MDSICVVLSRFYISQIWSVPRDSFPSIYMVPAMLELCKQLTLPQDVCLFVGLFIYRSMTLEEMFDRPVYNHIMSKEDCLAEAVSIMRLKLKTLRVEDLEVRMYMP